MAESLFVSSSESRPEQYRLVLAQIKALTEGEMNLVANLSNIAAALRQTFGFFWVGFYIVDGGELVLGPFQGDIACTRIGLGKGVCGTAWSTKATQLVADVDAFPGHIACSSASRSEVVVPVIKEGNVVAVLDVDSDQLDDFSSDDVDGLQSIADWISRLA